LLIDPPLGADGEDAAQLVGAEALARDLAQHVRGAAPPVGPFSMGQMVLIAVVGEPLLVHIHQLLPGLSLGEVPVGKPALDVEGGLDIRLPGPPGLDPPVRDPQRGVDRLGVRRLEDPSASGPITVKTAPVAPGQIWLSK
jgi:hypothetical protein